MIPSLPSLANISFALRSGPAIEIVRALVDCCLEQIDAFDARVQAWVSVDREGARGEAERLGRLLDEGKVLGPLHGIPVGIKDIVDVAGWPTKAGSPLRADHVAQTDAAVVAKLRAGGAILLGKTVTTEWACFDPPPTRNPWNLAHTPGGSSSGSAAAVAMEMCLAAIGSQTGGSIIRPAAYCGVAGFKPTFGSVSTQGVVPISAMLDHVGPIARCVEDLYRVFCVINGSSQQRLDEFTRSSASAPRLAVFDGYFDEQADEPVRGVFRAVLERIRAGGSLVETLRLPKSFAQVHAMHRRIMAYDAARQHRRQFEQNRTAFGPNVASLIEEGLTISSDHYHEAIVFRESMRLELTAALAPDFFVMTPSTSTTAPASLATTGDPKFNSPWSLVGFPTVTIPCGLAANGMPVGLQLIGPPFSDARVLNTALLIERLLKFRERPPILNSLVEESASNEYEKRIALVRVRDLVDQYRQPDGDDAEWGDGAGD